MRFVTFILTASAAANTVVAIEPIVIEPPPKAPDFVDPDSLPRPPESNPYGTIPDTTAPQKTNPYLPASEENPCFRKGPSCDEIVDIASAVVSGILSIVSDAMSGSSGDTTTTSIDSNAVYSAVPVFNVAAALTIDPDYVGVFNSAEYDMYQNDPLCFYANIERRYVIAAQTTTSSVSPFSTTEIATTTIPVTSTVITPVYGPGTAITSTQMGTSDASVAQSYLFRSLFPWMIQSIYAPVSQSSNATAKYATSSTTCSGLDGAPAFTTPYIAQVSTTAGTRAPSSTSTSTSTGAAMPTGYVRGCCVLSGIGIAVGLACLGAM